MYEDELLASLEASAAQDRALNAAREQQLRAEKAEAECERLEERLAFCRTAYSAELATRQSAEAQLSALLEVGKPFARIGELLDQYAAYKGVITLGENPWAEHFRALRAAHDEITGEANHG